MAGKRLLDAARLFNAGRSIAKQHIDLRQQQWDVFSKTSGLAKAVKSQTDRVTVTAGAAYELAKRFGEDVPKWQQQASYDRERDAGQNHDREASPPKATQTRSPTPSRDQPKSARYDEAQDDGTLSSLRKRELQRRAEEQIPSSSAFQQPMEDHAIGQDSYGERPQANAPELSSLPRMKIPKHANATDDSSKPLGEKSLNQDVFYVPGKDADTNDMIEGATIEGLFATPRVSRMMGQQGQGSANPYSGRKKSAPRPLPEMIAAEKRWSDEGREDTKPASSESVARDQSTAQSGDSETHDLAKSIAAETAIPAQSAETTFEMRESRVPSSRFGRLWQYGGLATSMAFGAVGESFRRMTGGSSEGSLMLSEGNMNRLVAKLSRMRGAALKLGQMMSFQDSKILPPTINAVLQRVQDSADYMPPSQRNKVLVDNLGSNWRDLYLNFEEKPFAAASIGQVHKATLASNGKDVAVKVQYPGVRNSIDSDLNNLALLLTASQLLPKGLYLDKTIANARVELGWECDYEREAKACIKFAELLQDESGTFKVPEIYTEASGPGVLTAEFMTGTAVTKMKDISQNDQDWVGTQILRLCLRELMEWRFMQTDPNWTNFLYNKDSKKLELLDFGASRDFPDKFVEPYVSLLIAASKGDREKCKDYSIELGYLTGHESKDMLKAHVDSILTLAEPFVESAPEVYDFEDQTITDRVRANIGLMLRERLAPPPEETYSLHRKLSGAFLLCARLKSKVKAREMFANAVQVWNKREFKGEHHSTL
jgi:aarF domain-containing kinase